MNHYLKIFLIFLLLSSCKNLHQTDDLQKNLQPVWKEYFKEDFSQTKSIQVFVATNRNAKLPEFGCSDKNYGVDVFGVTAFGLCEMRVPKGHEVGSIDLISGKENYAILAKKSFSEDEFLNELKKSKATPLVFVHGFNVRYQEAVLRAAQVAYDLKYQGPIILFTWPSGAKETLIEGNLMNKTYESNFANTKLSVEPLKIFLQSLQKKGIKVNLAVHSMGHQVALPALQKMAEEKPNKIFVHELFLNAPDFEISEFRSIVKNIKSISKNITLYCSYNDKAMTASKIVNKNERLGACANIDEVDVINVGAIDDAALGLGHGYYSSREVLSDMFLALLGIEAKQRLFISKSEILSPEKYLLRK